jgi:CheY-like chemotaxis protein
MGAKNPDTPRARVLVIDNEVVLGRAIARMLVPEHDITLVTSGQEALDRIEAGERFDLILCDLLMPEMTGADFYHRLAPRASELVGRVVFITGGAFAPWATAFLARPSIHHIDKPFPQLAEFRRVVREHLQRVGGSNSSPLELPDE